MVTLLLSIPVVVVTTPKPLPANVDEFVADVKRLHADVCPVAVVQCISSDDDDVAVGLVEPPVGLVVVVKVENVDNDDDVDDDIIPVIGCCCCCCCCTVVDDDPSFVPGALGGVGGRPELFNLV